MRKIRVYVGGPLAAGARLSLPAFAAEHLTRVLRLPDGAEVACFNGDGHDYACRLEVHGKGQAAVHVGAKVAVRCESPLALTLVQAVARGEKMDFILQKATELGVARVLPVVSERTEVKLDEDRAGKRLVHWQRVVESACEQSGRAVVPTVEPPVTLGRFAEAARYEAELKVVLHPEGEHTFATLPAATGAMLAVGPEGGFSDRDLAMLKLAGFVRTRMGPRILRTETAGLAAITALQARFGDLS